MQNKISGIYTIKNEVNQKMYIGASTNILDRKYRHSSNLKHNKHPNRLLQADYNCFESNDFVFEILEECPSELVMEREKYYIAKFKSNHKNYGYNILEGGRHFQHQPESITLMVKNRDYKYGKDSTSPIIFHFIDPEENVHVVKGIFKNFCDDNYLSYRTMRRAINKGKVTPCPKSNPSQKRINSIGWEVIRIGRDTGKHE